jgi:hypothetical protein
LIPAGIAGAGSLVALGGVFFFTGRAVALQEDPETSCSGSNLDEINACLQDRDAKIATLQKRAGLSAKLSLGLFIGATIPLGVGFIAKKSAKERTK